MAKIASQDEKTQPAKTDRTKKVGGLTLGGAASGSKHGAKRTCGIIWASFDVFFRRFDAVFARGPGGGPWEGDKEVG